MCQVRVRSHRQLSELSTCSEGSSAHCFNPPQQQPSHAPQTSSTFFLPPRLTLCDFQPPLHRLWLYESGTVCHLPFSRSWWGVEFHLLYAQQTLQHWSNPYMGGQGAVWHTGTHYHHYDKYVLWTRSLTRISQACNGPSTKQEAISWSARHGISANFKSELHV